jgi:hypothetical protein
MRKTAKVLDEIRDGLITAYQQRTGKGRDELKKMLENETWMSATRCVDEGFADDIYGGAVRASAQVNARMAAKATSDEIRKLILPHTENHLRTLKAAETFDRELLLEAFLNDPNTAAKCTDAAALRKLIDDMITATAAYLPAGWN